MLRVFHRENLEHPEVVPVPLSSSPEEGTDRSVYIKEMLQILVDVHEKEELVNAWEARRDEIDEPEREQDKPGREHPYLQSGRLDLGVYRRTSRCGVGSGVTVAAIFGPRNGPSFVLLRYHG